MASILVVEDDRDIAAALEYNIRREGYRVFAATSGRDGLQIARERRPDLVLLDLMLPDIPGTEICTALKNDEQTSMIRIIMLTAKSDEIDRVLGFELGADDYVIKPFSMNELLHRIRAILGRSGRKREERRGDEFGCLRIDHDSHRVWVEEVEVDLTALEFRLLTTLYDCRDRVLTRKSLLETVWSITEDVETRTVDTHMKRLREKLKQAGRYLETVRGVGYRFARTADVAGLRKKI